MTDALKCPGCGSTGFPVSFLHAKACAFCDGTEGGLPLITEFRGEYRFLSNFYPCPLYARWHGATGNGVAASLRGHRLPVSSVEHAYQAMKAERLEDFTRICNAPRAGDAKRLGRKVLLRDDWEKVKLVVMRWLVFDKFSESRELKRKLLDTGDAGLIEGNYWKDHYWGVCNGRGENHLGKILMEVREQLR